MFRTFLISLIIFFSLSTFGTHQIYTRAQEPFDPHAFMIVNPLPPIDFTLTEVIDIISDFNISQQKSEYFCDTYMGLTYLSRKQIEICANMDLSYKRETIIHEIIHVMYARKGLNTSGPFDPLVQEKARAVFKALYGFPEAASNASSLETPKIP